jgi:hypothetical protein
MNPPSPLPLSGKGTMVGLLGAAGARLRAWKRAI